MEVYEDLRHQISVTPTDMPSPSSVASTPSPDAADTGKGKHNPLSSGRRWRPGKTKAPADLATPPLNGAPKKLNKSRRPNDNPSSSVPPRSPARPLTRPRWAEQAQDTSLVVDDDEVEVNLNGSILLDDTTTTTPANKTSSGGRVDSKGLVSILKNFAECGDNDYLVCGMDGCSATDNDGAALPHRRGRHSLFDSCSDRPRSARPTSPDRTISSRVSFSDDRLVVVHELPRMSAKEKSRSFYSARELHYIRQDAREARLQQAEIDDDCNFFCSDFYDTFCVQEVCGGEEGLCKSRSDIYG